LALPLHLGPHRPSLMIPVPEKFEWGPKKLRVWLAELREFAIKSRLVNVMGGSLDEVDDGQILNIGGSSATSKFSDFALCDKSKDTDLKIGIRSGTVGGSPVTGLAWGVFTPVEVTLAATETWYAWLCVTYAEATPVTINSVTYDVGDAVPNSESGCLYVCLGAFSNIAGRLVVNTSPIGSQSFSAWRNWFSNPVTYTAECNPL